MILLGFRLFGYRVYQELSSSSLTRVRVGKLVTSNSGASILPLRRDVKYMESGLKPKKGGITSFYGGRFSAIQYVEGCE